MGATEVRHDRDEGRGPRPRAPRRAVGIQVREDLQRQGLAEGMDGHDHVRPPATPGPTDVRGIPRHALLERSEAYQLQHEIVQEQSQGGGTRLVEPLPKEGVFGHDLVGWDVHVVREGSVIGVYVDDVTRYREGEALRVGLVEDVECVTERVRGRAVSAPGVGHQDLDRGRRFYLRGTQGGGGGGGGSERRPAGRRKTRTHADYRG